MNPPATAARILIATDNASEGAQVHGLLEPHFQNVSVSSDPDSAVQDFADFKPDVVVLAFDAIEKAQGYCLGLNRSGTGLQEHPHRRILLCAKSELATAFELCKKQHFDDYVLHWPMAHDGKRLPMSVWIAGREILAAAATAPARTELRTHVKNLRDLESALDDGCSAATRKLAGAESALVQLEQDLASASDELAGAHTQGGDGTAEGADLAALRRESARLKAALSAKTHEVRTQAITPILSLPEELRARVEPALASAREFAEKLTSGRALIMVVDDDETSQEILARAVDAARYDIVFADESVAALNQLRHLRPDAILMDIRLPGVDGVTLTRHLKAAPHLADIPIIMLTGDARRETLLSSIDAGAADFIVKPFTRDSLNAKLKKVLNL